MAHSPAFHLMPTQEIEVVSREELAGNRALLARVDELLDRARLGREALNSTYIEIGIALDEVENTKAWMEVARTYDSYIKDHCEVRFGKSRTQLYAYRSAAKYLLPHVSAKQLVEIGATKAAPLAQYAKRHDGQLPESLIESASNPNVGVEEFKATVAETQNENPEKGKWFQIPGFFVTPEEKEEIERGLSRAGDVKPLPEDCPEWLKTKITVQRMVAEFLSTYPCTENG